MCGLLALLTDPSADVSAAPRRRGVRRVASDAPPRPGRAGHLGGRRRQPMTCSASTGCRSSTSRTATSRCGGARRSRPTATCWCSTARSTTTWSCAQSCAAEHGAVFATDGDSEAIVAAYHYWGTDALTRLRGMFAFACGTPSRGNCSAPATRSASSRCSWRPDRAGPRSAARRSACWTSPRPSASTSESTSAPCSTTRCCSTCRNRRRCTAVCAGSSRAATPAYGRDSRPR